MTIHVNVTQAKATLSELIARAEAGEKVIIARAGKPAVSLTVEKPGPRSTKDRVPGAWAHLRELMDPDMFLGPDPETDTAVAEHRIFPDES